MLGMQDDALRYLARAVEEEPDQARHHGSLGWGLFIVGRYDEAMASCRTAMALDGELAFVHTTVGLLHVIRRDLESATSSFSTAAELNDGKIPKHATSALLGLLGKRPDLTEAHYALAFCCEKRAESDTASEHYRKFVEAEKEGHFVGLARQRLEELEGR